ncbi:MAG: hypothetical protein IJI13_03030 [Oscillospiraceae bacterium]|nr:hypothetical protein [Oscillospiraceae bacterium]
MTTAEFCSCFSSAAALRGLWYAVQRKGGQTIIDIPFGKQFIKIAKRSLRPFGAAVV